MSDDMKGVEERIAEIRERLARVSPLPWMTDDRMPGKVFCDDSLGSMVAECRSEFTAAISDAAEDANAALIANAPADLQWALDQLSDCRRELEERNRTIGQMQLLAGLPLPPSVGEEITALRDTVQRVKEVAETAIDWIGDEYQGSARDLSSRLRDALKPAMSASLERLDHG